MADLQLDVAALAAAADRAEDIRGSLAAVRGASHDAATGAGHAGLGARIIAFDAAWEALRGRSVRDLDVLTDRIRAIAETFARLDERLAVGAPSSSDVRTGLRFRG